MKWIANYMFVDGKMLINHVANITADEHIDIHPADDELANTYYVEGALCVAHPNDRNKIESAFKKAHDARNFARRYTRMKLTPLTQETPIVLQLDFANRYIKQLSE